MKHHARVGVEGQRPAATQPRLAQTEPNVVELHVAMRDDPEPHPVLQDGRSRRASLGRIAITRGAGANEQLVPQLATTSFTRPLCDLVGEIHRCHRGERLDPLRDGPANPGAPGCARHHGESSQHCGPAVAHGLEA